MSIEVNSRAKLGSSSFRRHRRLRTTEALRSLVRETRLSTDQLMYPLFVASGADVKRPIPPMPGCYQLSVNRLGEELAEVRDLGLRSVLLFGVPDDKDSRGSGAYADDGVVQQAIRLIKQDFPELLVTTDVCMCEYTDHGHCGVLLSDGAVDNDATLELLAQAAVSHRHAGADILAPSAMMDGQVAAIRAALDAEGQTDAPIMGYSAKYASSFFGPFRVAAESAPQFGDRRAYQMDPPNAREALGEIQADIDQGVDIVMVKPALPYLDVIHSARDRFDTPIAAYNVSGEFAMVKAAAQNGWLEEKRTVLELLTAIHRAGADIIITYHAKDAARWLSEPKSA